MANVRSFLGEEYESLEREEEYLKGIMKEIREFETELKTEEKEVLLLEKIISRLKERVADFHRNVFPQIAIYLAKLNVRDANRQYDSRFDQHILAFAEIEFDCVTVNHVISQIHKVFERRMEDQLKEDKFYSHLLREHKEIERIMRQTRELLFGTDSTYNIYNLFFQNMHGTSKDQFIKKNFEEMKKSFMRTYNLR